MKNLNPVTKLLLGVLVVAIVLTATRPVEMASQTVLVLFAVLFFRKADAFARSLKLTAPMVALVFLVSWFSFDLETVVGLCLRLFNLLTSSFLVFGSLGPEDLSAAMRKMKIPFGFVFMITTALRFVPLMRKKIACIRDAQMSRGIDLRFKLKNAGNFMALMGPLLVQSFRFADELAIAMEVRGFGRKNRSWRKEYEFGMKDFLAVAAAIAAFAIFIAWQMDAGFENRVLAFVSAAIDRFFINGN